MTRKELALWNLWVQVLNLQAAQPAITLAFTQILQWFQPVGPYLEAKNWGWQKKNNTTAKKKKSQTRKPKICIRVIYFLSTDSLSGTLSQSTSSTHLREMALYTLRTSLLSFQVTDLAFLISLKLKQNKWPQKNISKSSPQFPSFHLLPFQLTLKQKQIWTSRFFYIFYTGR